MDKKGKQKGARVTILVKLLAMVLLPLTIMTVTIVVFSVNNMKQGMREQIVDGLRGTAYSFFEIYNALDAGDYSVSADGKFMKGDMDINDEHSVADRIKENTGYDVTLFYGDTRKITSVVSSETGERATGTKASEAVIDAVLTKGTEYVSYNADVNGENFYAYYLPIKDNAGTIAGMVFAGEPSATVDGFIAEKQNTIYAIAAFIFALALCVTITTSYSLSNAIKESERVIQELSNGNLTVQINRKYEKRSDEVGIMLNSLDFFKEKLAGLIGRIKGSADALLDSGDGLENMASQSSQTADEISRAVEDIAKGATCQAEDIEHASTNIGEMGDVIEGIVTKVDGLDHTSDDMKTASDESQIIIQQLTESNDRTTEAMDKISAQIHATNASVQTIRQAIELITEIATETNLLSLNASIEAARAGEHGRGFAVVATEIQKLAEQSNHSASEIEKVINELLKESENSVAIMEQVGIIVVEQQAKLAETKEKFAKVIDGVNNSREETRTIKDQTGICDNARGKVNTVIQNLSAISEENAASTEETTASMEELNATISLLADAAKDLKTMAVELDEDMKFFQI
ncbi:MAG: methyl-accepting chemotaxis protein [Lachnospiraceae bacterium]|nr:methyl-accepting chemotaxis protein [Lachnospiraceae bacterium]